MYCSTSKVSLPNPYGRECWALEILQFRFGIILSTSTYYATTKIIHTNSSTRPDGQFPHMRGWCMHSHQDLHNLTLNFKEKNNNIVKNLTPACEIKCYDDIKEEQKKTRERKTRDKESWDQRMWSDLILFRACQPQLLGEVSHVVPCHTV